MDLRRYFSNSLVFFLDKDYSLKHAILALSVSCFFVGFLKFLVGVFFMKRMYVGNLPFSSSEEDVRELFSQFGEVSDVNLIKDRQTGRPRGFGFVEMKEEDAKKAMESLDGTEFGGRRIRVNEARARR